MEKPLPLINAFILYVKGRGKIGHSCAYGAGPHNIKVGMLREDNSHRISGRLTGLVGPDRRLDSLDILNI